jgi:subtilisin family serine protease
MRIAYNDGMLVVCGEREREGGTVVTTLGYDPEGKMQFMQNFKSDSSSNHLVHSLSLFENNIYVHGITQQTGGDKYFALKYHYHVKESDYLYESGVPRRVEKELIIGFHPDLMKLDKIDHDHFMFAELTDFVDDYAIGCISSKTGIDFSKQIATKIFPECHSWDTISTSRLGKPVPIPKFWSMILVELPEAANDSILLDSILACSKYVDFASFNGIGQYANCPPNDPNYQAENQAGFASTLLTPDAHVNIEEAWCFASGSPEIKVGVIDSGIRHNHEDLHDTPGSESYDGSDVVGGYNLVINLDTPPQDIQEAQPTTYFHGTNVAGIISARRNNNIGVAGIAGRNGEQEGIQLYDLKIGNAQPGPQTVWARAMYIAATDEDQIGPVEFPLDINSGLGLHIINISLTGGELEIRKVTEYCFRNDVVIVAASGNWTQTSNYAINDPLYPASFRDEWVLKIGANDNTGGRAETFSVYDNDLDFIAPGVNDIYQSLAPSEGTQYNDSNDYASYTSTNVNMVPNPFQGTSFAAPHVTGIAALMKSYVDTNTEAPNVLSAEDVQNIMKTNDDGNAYYYDVPPTDYHEESGFGRPNAGKILEKLQLPCYKVRHFEGSILANEEWVNEGPTDVNIGSNQTALSTNLPFGFPTLNYNATRYKVTHTIPHNLQGGEVINYWKRDAASNLAPITSLLPGEGIDVTIDSFSETSATLSGYIYHIVVGNDEYWWPIEPTDYAIFAYSVYTFSPGEVPCITTSITEEVSVRANIYPNPAFDHVYVEWSEWRNTSNLQVFNTIGEMVSYHIITGQTATIAISHLSSGMYFFVLRSDDETRTFKIVKR